MTTAATTWDDIDVSLWEQLPIKTNLGFPYTQYVNHHGWAYRYTFSKNAHEGFLVMDVERIFDRETVFHGRVNPYDLVKAKDPITKCMRFLWVAFQIDFDSEDIVIYVFHVSESYKG